MTMRSPVVALLWEQWQLTRVEAAQRVGVSIVAASVALRLGEVGPTVAFGILMVLHSMFWLSISKLTGGRFLDGYKPGFPLQLLYTRPVPTVVFVGVAMAYDAISCVVLYLVSAALVGFAFDQPLPLFSVAGWIVTFHLVCTCLQWASRNRVVQWAGMIVTCLPLYLTLRNRVASPLHVEFSLAENVMLILIGVVSFAVAVAGVARQRHGGASVATPRTAGPVASPEWLVSLFSFSCPTSSAT
ncbi:MAG TPA: hypothetical protein VK629_08480, partial [Steroidobacteraceae bacterium]|nr:hypothetical protein [Steroidobacteraceae bacterium]